MKKFLKIASILTALVVLIFGAMVYVAMQVRESRVDYQGKALQSEAKTALLQVFISQKSFWAEHGIYTSSVAGGEKTIPIELAHYKFGFTNVLQPEEKTKKAILAVLPEFDPTKIDSDSLGLKPATEGAREIEFQKIAAEYGCVVSATSFKACAIGYPRGDDIVDVWTIKDDKTIENVKKAIE